MAWLTRASASAAHVSEVSQGAFATSETKMLWVSGASQQRSEERRVGKECRL